MNLNQPLSSQGLSAYPSIDAFSKLVSHSITTPLSAKILLDPCRNVARDLTYVSRLQEDAQLALNGCPAYHAQWIYEVRTAASEALYLANKHIESKLPGTQALHQLKGNQSDLQSKIARVVAVSKKDTEGIASLREHLSAAHASLMGVAGFMHQLAFRNGELIP